MKDSAIARKLGIADKSVTRAVAWFRCGAGGNQVAGRPVLLI